MVIYIIIPIVLGSLFWGWQRRKRFLAVLHLPPDGLWKLLIPIMIITMLFIILREPAINRTVFVKEYAGADVVFAVDVSLSMRAKDNTNSSRLNKAKEFIISCSDKFTDERVGLVIFAKKSFSWLPFLTTDKTLFNYFAHRLSTNIMSAQGTDFAGAVLKAVEILEDSSNKAIVLLTDGEIQGERVVDVVEAIKAINELDISLYIVPIGTTAGSFIPIENDELLKDTEGQLVETQLRLDILQILAEATDGKIVNEPFKVHESSRKFIGEKEQTQRKPIFQILLIVVLLLFTINTLIRK